jgi:transcriptional regulator with XRE-family HTH domain
LTHPVTILYDESIGLFKGSEVRLDVVGENVKEIRLRKGLSQTDLKHISGVGQDTISGLESGKHHPRPSTLRKLAAALGVEVEDFYKDPNAPKAIALAVA